MFEKIKTHTIRGRKYKLVWKKPDRESIGLCTSPDYSHATMFIDPKLDDEILLDTVIHECLHASFFDLDEEPIDTAARDIARLLTRMGYKLTADE